MGRCTEGSGQKVTVSRYKKILYKPVISLRYKKRKNHEQIKILQVRFNQHHSNLGPVHKQSQVSYNELELQFKSIARISLDEFVSKLIFI